MANLMALPARIREKIAPEPNTGCWLWDACTFKMGYACFYTGEKPGGRVVAHRRVYELLKGRVPSNLTLDHLCRVRSCVNPDHLEPVTRGENVLRGEGIPAQRSRQTHCIRGHELSGANLRLRPNGYRNCRACEAITLRARSH